MQYISSLNNPLIKSITKLRTKKGRELQKQFLAEGIRTCSSILQYELQPIHLFVTKKILDKEPTFIHNHPIIKVSEEIIKKISPVTTPSGIVGVFPIPPEPPCSLIQDGIVLTNMQDPGNVGTLIRTCVAFGKKTVILIEGIDPWSPKVIQASAGTIAGINLFRISWQMLLANKKHYNLIALTVKEGSHPQDINFKQSLLVIGSEAHGIADSWLKTCEKKLTIPMPGSAESLNAATAGAIAMYLAWNPKN